MYSIIIVYGFTFTIISCYFQQLPEFTEVELFQKDYISEITRIQELVEENMKLRAQVLDMKQTNEEHAESNTEHSKKFEMEESAVCGQVCVNVHAWFGVWYLCL